MKNNEKIIKVLVVDDSSFVRMVIENILADAKNIRVIGSASDGLEALDMMRDNVPDVITLDVEMPGMNGLDTLKTIMSSPVPVPCIMVSSLTTEGAVTTFKALEEGAVDFIAKPSSFMKNDVARLKVELVAKITAASEISPLSLRFKLLSYKKPVVPYKAARTTRKRDVEVVLIGISTGGPPALQKIIPHLPADFPAALVVAQHMPPGFTKSMADRLNDHSKIEVKETEEGDAIIPGRVLVAKSGFHMMFKERGGDKVATITSLPDDVLYYPSINVLFDSAAEVFGAKAMPIIMTGMGNDGLVGLRKLKALGSFSMAQSEESCVVASMPKAAIDEKLVDRIAGLDEMAGAIIEEI
ncbi:MAG: chemotaxis response regulator protein-glutamate methylesterase [Nitrospinae bacterium]|nr:chemotaxis response regulator protein-glutamate methylesterase [Nitrospinota bacterium]